MPLPALTPANLLTYALQVGAIIAVGAALPFVLRLEAPRARLACWRALLIVCLVLPLLQPAANREPSPAKVTPHVDTRSAVAVPGPAAMTMGAETNAAESAADGRRNWPVGLIAVGVVGAGILARLVWIALGILTLQRLRRRAPLILPRPDSIVEATELVGADAEFRVAGKLPHPVTFGAALPVVLVPERFAALDEGEQRAIACHELLHVRRLDWLKTTSDEVIRAIGWFHPAVWWLMDQIQLCREQIVDREAVRLLGARQPYLQALLRMAVPPAPALRLASPFLRRAHLRRRVVLLVKEVAMSRPRLALSFVVMAVVLFAAGRLVVGAIPLEMTQPALTIAPAAPGQPSTSPQQAGVTQRTMGNRVSEMVVVQAPAQGQVVSDRVESLRSLKVMSRVDPVGFGTQGLAVVRATVDANGFVSNAELLQGEGPSAAAALDAVRRWSFEPPDQQPAFTIIGFNVPSDAGFVQEPPARLSGDITPPRKIRDIKPAYPQDAQAMGLAGMQSIEAVIDANGIVRNAIAIRAAGGEPLMVAAMTAVLQWQFSPTSVDGVPTPTMMNVEVMYAAKPSASNWPAEAVRVGGNIQPPVKTKDVKPVYPPMAEAARVQGVVIIEAMIDAEGRVTGARVLRSIPLLDGAAVDAVKQWEFQPVMLNGRAVPAILTVTVPFTVK